MFKDTLLISVTVVFFLIAWSWNCSASELKKRLQDDFHPVETFAKDVTGSSAVLNAGASDHVSTGDIFSIFRRGEPVYVPGSRTVLGYERKRIGLCRVSAVRTNDCNCYIISADIQPRRGDPAVRFGELDAAFFVDGKPVEPELPEGSLRNILPWFKWLEPSARPSPVATPESMKALGIDILFQVQGDMLQVFGPDMERFRSYPLPPSFVFIKKNETSPETQKAGSIKTVQGKEIFDFKSARLVGRLDSEIIQADITDLDGDGRLEIIYLLKDRICIAPYRRKGHLVSLKLGSMATACNFSLMEKSGWLCINAALDQAGLNSKLLKYEHGSLRLVQDQINLWLGFLDTDCDGKRDSLLGQTYERARFRGRKIFRLAATDSGIEYIEKADYPGDFNVNSATSANLEGKGCFLYYVSFDGFFKVYGNGRHVWSSLKPVVRDTKCCGPAMADLVDLSQTRIGEPGILLNGMVSLSRDRTVDTVILFSRDGQNPALYQAGLNPKGRICSISLAGHQVIMAVITKNDETGNMETSLVEFPGT